MHVVLSVAGPAEYVAVQCSDLMKWSTSVQCVAYSQRCWSEWCCLRVLLGEDGAGGVETRNGWWQGGGSLSDALQCDPLMYHVKQMAEMICLWVYSCPQWMPERFRLVKSAIILGMREGNVHSFNESARLVAPRGQRWGEHQRRTAWWARHSKDTANDHLVQMCLY